LLKFHTAVNLFKFLAKYKPEDKLEKKTRLREEATATEKGEKVEKTKPFMLKYGLNHVVTLAEAKKAKLVIIAHDVQPIELVVFLPTLCRKLDIPFCIVKGKSRLGQLVHKKNASCVAITDVKPEVRNIFFPFFFIVDVCPNTTCCSVDFFRMILGQG
jgi:large subunit ribosomal protein L7Ae